MRLKVVYVDDEEEICQLFTEYIESDDVEVRTFSNPDIAVQELNANPPDLVFLDYRLPNTTGDQIAAQLDPALPKVLITGDLAVNLATRFVKVFFKPIEFAELQQFVRDYASARKKS